MSANPINLAFRFLLEVASLIAVSMWGWKQHDGWLRIVLVIVLPVAFAIIWGTFAVPNDPSRSGNAPVPVSGLVRIVLEFLFFGCAVWMLYNMRTAQLSLILVISVLVHYIISYDRLTWLIKQ